MRVPTVTLHSINRGTVGSYQTLGRMKKIINASLSDPLVITAARKIVMALPARDYEAHIRAVRTYLMEHVQFVPDPRGVEMLSTPHYLLTEINRRYMVQGDCDDAAILGCALAKAVGRPCRLVVLGFFDSRAPYSHVYGIAKGRSEWVDLDTTRPTRMAFEPPISRKASVEV